MHATRNNEVYGKAEALYLAHELSLKTWKLAFGDGSRERMVTVPAGDVEAVLSEVSKTRARFGLPEAVPVRSCYEAGRDGFWLHRVLLEAGVDNVVVDSSSIEVNRRHRRAKSDRVDALKLLRLLIRYWQGERRALSVVRVPPPEWEDARRLHRERENVLKDRGRVRNRIRGLLATQGIVVKDWREASPERLRQRGQGPAGPLGAQLLEELERLWAQAALFDAQLKEVDEKRRAQLREAHAGGPLELIQLLMQLRAIGDVSAWVLVHELFGWREFRNRRELGACVGLTPTPYASGASQREQGISKAGSRRLRSLLVELAWGWLRWQPDSELSRWFRARFDGGKRARKVGIVALARRLLVALWRLTRTGELPAGAVVKPAT
jgi:transposase